MPCSVKAAIKNRKNKNHNNPDNRGNKALILTFLLFARVSPIG
jgi:hypothetical protein